MANEGRDIVLPDQSESSFDPNHLEIESVAHSLGLPPEVLKNPEVQKYLQIIIDLNHLQQHISLNHSQLLQALGEGKFAQRGATEGMLAGYSNADLMLRATLAILRDPTDQKGQGDYIKSNTSKATAHYKSTKRF